MFGGQVCPQVGVGWMRAGGTTSSRSWYSFMVMRRIAKRCPRKLQGVHVPRPPCSFRGARGVWVRSRRWAVNEVIDGRPSAGEALTARLCGHRVELGEQSGQLTLLVFAEWIEESTVEVVDGGQDLGESPASWVRAHVQCSASTIRTPLR